MRFKNRYLLTRVHFRNAPSRAPGSCLEGSQLALPKVCPRVAGKKRKRQDSPADSSRDVLLLAPPPQRGEDARRRLGKEASATRGKGTGLHPIDIFQAVKSSVISMWGDAGAAFDVPTIAVKYLNNFSQLAVIRCGRECAVRVRGALTFVTRLKAVEVTLEIVQVCGSIRTCKKALLERQRNFFSTFKASNEADKSSSPVREELEKLESEDIAAINALEM